MHNVLINESALIEAARTTLKLSYAGYENKEDVEDIVFEFALEETKEIIGAYFRACRLRLVNINR